MKEEIKRRICNAAAIIAAAAVAMLCNSAIAQMTIDEIAATLPETPRADGAPASDRAKWGPLAASAEGKRNIAMAEKIVGEPIPETPDGLYLEFSKNGNRSNYERCHGRLRKNFIALYIGECLEHKGRFIPKIVECLDAYCAMKSWSLPAHDKNLECFNGRPHVDLASAETSRELAFCLSWLGDSIPAATRKKVYSESDIALCCSEQEALGRVMIEGMLAGCLVITSDFESAKEIVDETITGYIYEQGNSERLADVIEHAITNAAASRELAVRGQQYALHAFDAAGYAKTMIGIYEELLGSNHE